MARFSFLYVVHTSMSTSLPVTFFCPQRDECARVEGPPVEATVAHWTVPHPVRVRAWVVQTVMRLREAGHTVHIQPTLPDEGIVVLLPEPHLREEFMRQFEPRHRNLLVVTIRADIVGFRSPIADAEIVQNGYFADETRVFDVPHWPQPGLIPRNPERGSSIQTIAFKGDRGNLHPELFSDRFYAFLEDRGITVRLEETVDRHAPQPWHDYEDVDLLIAVRKPWHNGDLFYDKPASKLINAWHAGVPALLGPEHAFRELREHPLDYFEVSTDDEAMAAISRLLDEPGLYAEMVAHGQQRAQDFNPERVAERWAEILFDKVPRIAETSAFRLSRPLPLSMRQVWNVGALPPAPHEARKMAGFTYRKLRQLAG